MTGALQEQNISKQLDKMVQKLPQKSLGSQGLKTSQLGLGIMSFANPYGDEKHQPSEKENQEVLERAAELGVTFIDTADVYGSGYSEEQFGIALKKDPSKYTVATKFGNQYVAGSKTPGGIGKISGTPEYIRYAVEESLKRLNVDSIDLYYQHRVDRTIPIEETWKELKKLVESGKVKYLGISEATADELRRAHAIHPITAIQLEWSLFTRSAEEEIIPVARELGIGIVPYSPLGRGILTGEIAEVADLSPHDRRRNIPRFNDENFKNNVELVAKLKEIAKKRGATPGQIALAWLHAQGDDVFPIPGTKRVKYLEENVAAYFIKLSKEEVNELSNIFHPQAVHGGRAAEAQAKNQFEAQKGLTPKPVSVY